MDDYCKPETDPVRSFLVGACEQRMQELNTVYTREVSVHISHSLGINVSVVLEVKHTIYEAM